MKQNYQQQEQYPNADGLEAQELTAEEIELQGCDCLHCTAKIWDRRTGYRDFVTPRERLQVTEYPELSIWSMAGYTAALVTLIWALVTLFGVSR